VVGEAPGEQVSSAPFVPYSTEDVAEVAKVARMLLERKLAPSVRMTEALARATLTLAGQVQIPVTKGLLDALVLTPWGPPAVGALIAGRRPEVTHVEVQVNGLPGFRATLEVAAWKVAAERRELDGVFSSYVTRATDEIARRRKPR